MKNQHNPDFARTAPPLQRHPMPARPWFGFWRGLLATLLSGRRSPGADVRPPAWRASARRRRRALLGATALCGGAAALLFGSSAPADPSPLWSVHAALGVLLIAWIGAGTATAALGAWVLARGDRHGLALPDPRAPIDAGARTAIVMPICNEDVETVFAGLRATCESVAATGALRLFDFYLLSDSSDPALRAAELRAWQRLRVMLGDEAPGARVFYRHRRRRTRRKAGNVADFCRRWGARYRYMVVLDADSAMHGETLVALVRLMEAHPNAGIVQTLPQPYGHATLHARVQQFATRVVGRVFALGMSWWQLGESHYWGHNAIIRVEPFMRHCALAPIPGRGSLAGEILSHDFVEAALMRRAGFEVWLAPQLEGSWEQLPPNLIDELQRDRRWCRGNLQNARLIAEPGFAPVHRVMLAVGALSYAMAPLWLAFVGLGLAAGGGAHLGSSAALWMLTLALLLAPRAIGVAAVFWRREQADYGGSARLVASALLETAVSAVQAPVRMLAHSAFVLGPLAGLRVDWKSPTRDAQRLPWRDALGRIGALALPVAAGLALALPPEQGLAALPLAALLGALVLSVPLAVAASHPRWGARLRARRVLGVPDEQTPPRPLQRAVERAGFADLVPPAPPPTVAAALRRPARPGMQRFGHALAGLAVCTLATLAPRQAATPELPEALRVEAERLARGAAGPAADSYDGVLVAAAPVKRVRPGLRSRPARMIDDAVRERALDAVRRALLEASDEAV